MELKPRITMPHDVVSVVKPVYTWDTVTEVGNANSFTACEVVGTIYGNPRCVGEQVACHLSNGVIVDFLEGSDNTAEEVSAVERWVLENSVKTLSGLYNPRNLVDNALLLVHSVGGLEVTLTQEAGKEPYTYRLVGNPEEYLPAVWVGALPAKVRIKLRKLWADSEGGYTDYFDGRDLTLLKKWLAAR